MKCPKSVLTSKYVIKLSVRLKSVQCMSKGCSRDVIVEHVFGVCMVHFRLVSEIPVYVAPSQSKIWIKDEVILVKKLTRGQNPGPLLKCNVSFFIIS